MLILVVSFILVFFSEIVQSQNIVKYSYFINNNVIKSVEMRTQRFWNTTED